MKLFFFTFPFFLIFLGCLSKAKKRPLSKHQVVDSYVSAYHMDWSWCYKTTPVQDNSYFVDSMAYLQYLRCFVYRVSPNVCHEGGSFLVLFDTIRDKKAIIPVTGGYEDHNRKGNSAYGNDLYALTTYLNDLPIHFDSSTFNDFRRLFAIYIGVKDGSDYHFIEERAYNQKKISASMVWEEPNLIDLGLYKKMQIIFPTRDEYLVFTVKESRESKYLKDYPYRVECQIVEKLGEDTKPK